MFLETLKNISGVFARKVFKILCTERGVLYFEKSFSPKASSKNTKMKLRMENTGFYADISAFFGSKTT